MSWYAVYITHRNVLELTDILAFNTNQDYQIGLSREILACEGHHIMRRGHIYIGYSPKATFCSALLNPITVEIGLKFFRGQPPI